MRGFIRRSLACLPGLVALAVLSTATPSYAGHAYDGAWSLTFITRSGDCDPSYNFNVNVFRGRISHPNLVRFQGYITPKGYARASVGVGNKYASGAGRLSGASGGGSWRGFSGTARCSGRWTAMRL